MGRWVDYSVISYLIFPISFLKKFREKGEIRRPLREKNLVIAAIYEQVVRLEDLTVTYLAKRYASETWLRI